MFANSMMNACVKPLCIEYISSIKQDGQARYVLPIILPRNYPSHLWQRGYTAPVYLDVDSDPSKLALSRMPSNNQLKARQVQF
jgi:hypothetical protein